jgi:hypothetical protein
MRRAVKTIVVLAVLISTQFVTANAEAMTFKQSFGGTNRDWGFGIFVDPHYIYVVGETESFGPDPPNLFLSIFSRADNSHKCSVAVNLWFRDRGWRVVAYGGIIYIVGETTYGANPTNILLVKLDANCNLLGAAVYDINGTDLPRGLDISPDGSTLYVAGMSDSGAHLLAVRTSDLAVVWTKLFNFTVTRLGAYDVANSVIFSSNKLYVTGRISAGDLFISRFDAVTGNHELSKVFKTSQEAEGRDIVVTGGKVYVAGAHYDPNRYWEFLFMRLDAATLNLEFAKTYGTPASDEISSLSMVGGLAYGVGATNVFGGNAVLFAIDSSTGDLLHALVLATGYLSLRAEDSTSTESCLLYTGITWSGWPAYHAVLLEGVTTEAVSFTISTVTPTVKTPIITQDFPTPAAATFTPTFNSPAAGDAFYSWFCPDTLVVTTTTTTTSTILTTLTLSTTVTSTSIVRSTTTLYDIRSVTTTQTTVRTITSSTTVYDIRTTTITQTSFVTATTTQLTTYSTTISAITTLTRSTTYSTTATQSTTTTITQSITTTLSTITTSTQYFAEPITTYVVPLLLVINTALLGASLVMGRRRKLPSG